MPATIEIKYQRKNTKGIFDLKENGKMIVLENWYNMISLEHNVLYVKKSYGKDKDKWIETTNKYIKA